MKNILHIAGKELRTYFSSPLAYVIMFVFLVISGYMFVVSLQFFMTAYMMYARNPGMLDRLNVNEMVVRPLMHNLSVVLLFAAPVYTMRLIAEEKRLQTIELLLTSPLTSLQIALGKYLGGVVLFAIMLLFTAPVPITLLMYGRPDAGPLALSYLGLFLVGSMLLAVGLLASSFTKSQLIAALVGFGLLLMLWLIGWAGESLGGTSGEVLTYLSVTSHLDDLTKGVFDTSHVVYFLSAILLCLVVSQQMIDAHRWR